MIKKNKTKPTQKTNKKVLVNKGNDEIKTEKSMEKDKIYDLDKKFNELASDFDTVLELAKPKQKEKSKEEVLTQEVNVTNKTNVEWLEEQIVNLTQEVTKYENLYLDMKKKYENVQPPKQTVDVDVKRKLIKIYKELNDNYTGNNPSGKRWENVRIMYILQKLKESFDFL